MDGDSPFDAGVVYADVVWVVVTGVLFSTKQVSPDSLLTEGVLDLHSLTVIWMLVSTFLVFTTTIWLINTVFEHLDVAL